MMDRYRLIVLLGISVVPLSFIPSQLDAKQKSSQQPEVQQSTNFFLTQDDLDSGRKTSKVRSAIWELWHTQKNGEINETRPTKEGVAVKTNYLVIQRNPGKWSVQIHRTWWPTKNGKPDNQTLILGATSIRRVRAKGKSKPDVSFVPDGEKIPSNLYTLRFFDETGKEIWKY
jgi:hypothetical protein